MKSSSNGILFQVTLKAARVNVGLSQEQVAKRMEVTRQTVINWETGKIIPGIPEMEMLSTLYGIPTDYIFLPCYSTLSRANNKNKEEGARDEI